MQFTIRNTREYSEVVVDGRKFSDLRWFPRDNNVLRRVDSGPCVSLAHLVPDLLGRRVEPRGDFKGSLRPDELLAALAARS